MQIFGFNKDAQRTCLCDLSADAIARYRCNLEDSRGRHGGSLLLEDARLHDCLRLAVCNILKRSIVPTSDDEAMNDDGSGEFNAVGSGEQGRDSRVYFPIALVVFVTVHYS